MASSRIPIASLTAWVFSVVFSATGLGQSSGNLIQNGGFEDGPPVTRFLNLPEGSTDLPGWTVINGGIDYIESYWVHPEGSRSLDLHGDDSAGGISQTVATVPGRMYRLRFELAGNPVCEKGVKLLRIEAGTVNAFFTFDTIGHSTSNMGWTPTEWWFIADRSVTEIKLFSGMKPSFCGPAIDDVSLEEFDLHQNLLVNPNAEAGLLGWTPSNGAFSVRDFDPPAIEGDWYFYGGDNTPYSEASQDVDVSEWSSTIDNGEQFLFFEGYVAQWHAPPPLDRAIIRIECLSSNGVTLDTWESDSPQSEKFFEQRTLSRSVQPGTRTIRLTMIAERLNGSNCDGYFDDLFLALAPQRLGISGDDSILAGEIAIYKGKWAMPDEYAWILIGGAFTPGNGVAIPGCPGLVSDLSDVRQFRHSLANENGAFHIQGRFPLWASGKTAFLQAVDTVNCRLSNVLSVEVH